MQKGSLIMMLFIQSGNLYKFYYKMVHTVYILSIDVLHTLGSMNVRTYPGLVSLVNFLPA